MGGIKTATEKAETKETLVENLRFFRMEIRQSFVRILSISDLSYSIGEKTILKRVNLGLDERKTYVIRGDNGAGKSTLLKLILNGDHHAEAIQWNAQLDPRRSRLSYLGHDLGLYSSLSLEENLRYFHSLSPTGYSWEQVENWVEVCNLHRRWEDPIYGFSRGMKQKASLLRAILSRPYLLLLDEPFTGLDEKSYPKVMGILREIGEDTTVLGVVHGMEDCYWQESYILERGEIRANSST